MASATKSDGFTNNYAVENLTFSKTVTGNQGSKDKYFKFTVKIENAIAGTVYDVSYGADSIESTPDGNADIHISANPNSATTCITSDVSQPLTITVPEGQTEVEQVFYLQHGQSIVIRGLIEGTKYTITEYPEDYTASATITGDTKTGDAEGEGTVITLDSNYAMSDDCIKDDAVIDFTNDRSGTIPAGVLLAIAAPAAVGIAAIGGITYLLIKNKRRKAEEE